MSHLRRFKSMEDFCLHLEASSNEVLKRNIYSDASSKTPKGYMANTFNSGLRKQPSHPKEQHSLCKAPFCQEMEKLLDQGLWFPGPTHRNKRPQNSVTQPEDHTLSMHTNNKVISSPISSSAKRELQNYLPVKAEIETKSTPQKRHNQTIAQSIDGGDRRAKLKLQHTERENELLRQAIKHTKKQFELKRRSRLRHQKIRRLLKEMGAPDDEVETIKYQHTRQTISNQ